MVYKNEVRHQDNVRQFDWNKSYIKNVVLENLKKDLGDVEEIRLLTKDEVEELPKAIKGCDDWYWTMSANSDSRSRYVWYVSSAGSLYGNYANNAYGVRPVIKVKKEVILMTEEQMILKEGI